MKTLIRGCYNNSLSANEIITIFVHVFFECELIEKKRLGILNFVPPLNESGTLHLDMLTWSPLD